jgi:Flp pilus assembly protein TadD
LANYESALRLQPNNLSAALGLALCHNQAGQIPEAIADYRRVLALDGTSVTALNNLAWLLATTADAQWRNGAEAVRLAGQACQLTHAQQTIYLGTLAAAYAEAGDFAQAVVTAQRAITVATKNGETRLATRNAELLEQYRVRQPVRD